VVLLNRASAPMAVFLSPEVLEKRAFDPVDVLLLPVVFSMRACVPVAVLSLPAVFAWRAPTPVAVFLTACLMAGLRLHGRSENTSFGVPRCWSGGFELPFLFVVPALTTDAKFQQGHRAKANQRIVFRPICRQILAESGSTWAPFPRGEKVQEDRRFESPAPATSQSEPPVSFASWCAAISAPR
jgi:hypothetical protein